MPQISNELFTFLGELSQNNNREWFAANKLRYENEVRDRAVAWIEEMIRPVGRVAPMLSVVASAHRGSLLRIYRDTRFSKDKTPYKTNVGISFNHQAEAGFCLPGAYIHLSCDECFVGVGCWRPNRDVLRQIRSAILDNPDLWKKVRRQPGFCRLFKMAGESLKTAPRDIDPGHPLIEDLRRIDFIAVSPLSRDEATSSDATKFVVNKIKAARPMMTFLCDAAGVPY
jgi:uncharacterized protein (TIGR02453 family)